jgi:hypothetical protein
MAAKCVAATFVAGYDLAGKPRSPISSGQSKKWPVREQSLFQRPWMPS